MLFLVTVTQFRGQNYCLTWSKTGVLYGE